MHRLILCLLAALVLTPVPAGSQDARSYAPSISHGVQGAPAPSVVNARDHGAACNGTTDDTAAIRAGLAAATARSPVGGVLSLPLGTCVLSDAIAATLSSKLTLLGAGRGATILQWTNPGGGMALTYTGQYNAPRIQGVSFHTTRAGGGTALTLTLRPAARSANALGPILDDVEFRGRDTKADYWTDGIHLIDVWHGALSNFMIKGKDETVLPFSMASGVKYTRAQGLFLRGFIMQHITDAVLQTGTTFGEGLNASEFELVGVKNGFNLSSWTSGALAIQGIQNGHINAYARGITTKYIVQGNFSGLLIYKTGLSTSNFIGIEWLIGASNNRAIGNHIEDNPSATGAWTGVLVGSNAAFNTVIGNTCDYAVVANAACIALGTNAANNVMIGNAAGSSGAAIDTVYLNGDAGSNVAVGNRSASGAAVANNSRAEQTLLSNSPLPDQVLAIDNTTPSVKSPQHELWRTGNHSATMITYLADGTIGQRVTILLDANTGFTHNAATFVLAGGNNIAIGAGKGFTISFVRYRDKWVEQSRSF